ncbi:hypothetical protein A2V49_04565 [candidate division WWE3 bacterium RBG_19FT_COMBO_34_6]|uniref:Fucosyltransferase C-terminal domain-containing protein n=1 Tax=candidate division WWE3 bacterium RBG_19FT_COMBO_34_6 TaxID=1802612 RepID=A0A1F4UMS0_UNCKA|nr:MAG: hypothetical protein A2V49_04565 [candidate division WWE3 bacterium RBG_19FT_COMBO_34_6]
MIKIKISTSTPDWPLLRQTSQSKGVVGNCLFFVDNYKNQDFDYWIVYDDLVNAEETVCYKDNLFLITPEPPTVKHYSNKFVSQFSTIITCQRNIKHQNILFEQQALPWHVGRNQKNHENIGFSLDYDSLKKINIDNIERKLLSVIISNKAFTAGHKRRLKFVEYLLAQKDISLDVFGRGFNEIADKWDTVYNYKYHLVLENFIVNDYWTEKLSDCFLGGAYPIYSGAPNIEKYFDKRSLNQINIDNFNKSKEIILKTIRSNKYEEAFPFIIDSRNKVLEEYNIFPFIVNIINKRFSNGGIKEKIHLMPNRACISTMERIELRISKFGNKYL